MLSGKGAGMNRDDIHTCHADCQRPTCVAVREAVAAEREACAKVADEHMDGTPEWNSAANNIASAIRARGQG
jgi:hypothetical protein